MKAPKFIAAGLILASLIAQACRTTTPPNTKAANRPQSSSETQASVPPRPPESASQCDPNYSGCVPIASDVDCAGGRGNGPAYVKGPVTIIGKDIYKLDGDHNGIGCE
jgi:hypothetical protein